VRELLTSFHFPEVMLSRLLRKTSNRETQIRYKFSAPVTDYTSFKAKKLAEYQLTQIPMQREVIPGGRDMLAGKCSDLLNQPSERQQGQFPLV